MMRWNGYMVPDTCDVSVMKLQKENAHPRDSLIAFDEGPHKYYICGQSTGWTSVTSVIHRFCQPFDSLETATRMVNSSYFPRRSTHAIYRSMFRNLQHDKELMITSLISYWDINAKEARDLGTKMHNDIEMFYNEEPHDSDGPEFALFKQYHRDQREQGRRAFRTEVVLWSREHMVCGSCDMLYRDAGGNFHLRDWKRSKKIRRKSFGKQKMKGRLSHLPDCNYSHYSLQLNLYRYLLETFYDMPISSMAIVVFHPAQEQYLEIMVPRMQRETLHMLQDYRDIKH